MRRAYAAHDDAGSLPHTPAPPVRSEVLPGQLATGRRIALYQWAFSVVLLLVVVGTVGTYMLRRTATDQAIRDARALTEVVVAGRDQAGADAAGGERRQGGGGELRPDREDAGADVAGRAREGLESGRPGDLLRRAGPDRPAASSSPTTRCRRSRTTRSRARSRT